MSFRSECAGNGGQNNYSRPSAAASDADGFMNIPDERREVLEDAGLDPDEFDF